LISLKQKPKTQKKKLNQPQTKKQKTKQNSTTPKTTKKQPQTPHNKKLPKTTQRNTPTYYLLKERDHSRRLLYLAVILESIPPPSGLLETRRSLDASLCTRRFQNALFLRQPKAGLYFPSVGLVSIPVPWSKPLEVIGAISDIARWGLL